MTKNDPTNPELDLQRKQRRREMLRSVGIAVVATVLAAACTKLREDDTKLGISLDPKQTHLVFTLPAANASGSYSGRKTLTFRIPREYVDLDSVLSKNGNIYQLTVPFELPGPRPQSGHVAKGPQAASQPDGPAPVRSKRIRAQLGTGSGVGGRELLLHSIDPANRHGRKDLAQDGMAYGLVRYSPIRCYTPEHLKDPQLKAFLDSKPLDDPMPQSNCRVDRRGGVLFSPPEVTAEDQVVYISCGTSFCWVGFNFDGAWASVNFYYDQLEQWTELVNPARELLRGFIVRDASSTEPQRDAPVRQR